METEYQQKYPNSILLVLSGNFYNVYGKDAYLLSYLFRFKLTKKGYKTDKEEEVYVPKTGFPRNALDKVLSGEYDSALSVKRVQTFTWYKGKTLNYDLQNIPRTQDIEPIFYETSAFFIFRKEVFTEMGKRRIGNKPYFQEIDDIEAVDIDYPEDFKFAQAIMKSLNSEEEEIKIWTKK